MKRVARFFSLVGGLLLAVGCGMQGQPGTGQDPVTGQYQAEVAPITRHGEIPTRETYSPAIRAKGTTTFGINYHGGPVMLGTTNIYFIWYGNWSSNTGANALLTNMVSNEGGSPYYNINTTYYQGSGTSKKNVSNALHYAGQTTDNYSQGSNLADANIQAIVFNAISKGNLPKDTNGVYFVLTSADVTESSGFCSQYCGWHTNAAYTDGSDIKFAFIGDPDQCPASCEFQTTSPNNNASADGMASIIAHELEESTSDPDGNAWWNTRTGEENADQCAWTYGTTKTASNGSKYNLTLGGTNYLIQQNWVNALVGTKNGACAMKH